MYGCLFVFREQMLSTVQHNSLSVFGLWNIVKSQQTAADEHLELYRTGCSCVHH